MQISLSLRYLPLLFLLLSLAGCSKKDEPIIELKVLRQDLVLRSQADITAFMVQHRDAKRIALDGNLTIGMPVSGGESSDITSLEALVKLKEVRKNLIISMNGQLRNLRGLENLDRVHGTLRLIRNGINQAPELNQLARVDSLLIRQNAELPSLTNLGQLRRIGTLMVEENGKLESLQGLGGMDSVTNLHIRQNALLADLQGLELLTKVKGALHLEQNPQLESLQGLDVLINVQSVRISGNPRLVAFCPLAPALRQLLADHPEATDAELADIIQLGNNGRTHYNWQLLLQECDE